MVSESQLVEMPVAEIKAALMAALLVVAAEQDDIPATTIDREAT
jgi:hypothetical protein